MSDYIKQKYLIDSVNKLRIKLKLPNTHKGFLIAYNKFKSQNSTNKPRYQFLF